MGRFNKARGVVLDLDGVLIDSEPLFLKAINQVLAGEGARPLTEEENKALIGTGVDDTWNAIVQLRHLPNPLAYYKECYDQVVPKVLHRELVLQPGVKRLIEAVRARGLPLGLATGSRRKWVDLKLKLVGLDKAFDVTIAGDEIERGKPAPDVYLEVARRLGVSPRRCLAVEDSPSGVAAAVAAGLFTVAVRTPATVGLDISQAHLVLDNLEELDLDLLGSSALVGGEG